MNISKTIVGVDVAKRVFQLYWVEGDTGEEMSLFHVRLSRAKFLNHFANRMPCLVAMEACGGSQHWARRLQDCGHEVRILPANRVRAFVRGNKNDAHDARAIWIAVQQPGIRTVAVKTEEQQAVLALHRMRQQLVKFRTAQINGLRGLLAEYGEVMPKGQAGLKRDLPGALARISERLSMRGCDPRWTAAARPRPKTASRTTGRPAPPLGTAACSGRLSSSTRRRRAGTSARRMLRRSARPRCPSMGAVATYRENRPACVPVQPSFPGYSPQPRHACAGTTRNCARV